MLLWNATQDDKGFEDSKIALVINSKNKVRYSTESRSTGCR